MGSINQRRDLQNRGRRRGLHLFPLPFGQARLRDCSGDSGDRVLRECVGLYTRLSARPDE